MSDSNKDNNLQKPKKFGFGIISTAKIARKTIDAIFKSKDATVVCIGSRDKKQAEDYAKELKIVDNSSDDQKLVEQIQCYGSYEEVLDDPKVNAVYIPLPSTMKREWAMKAIAKGKHILVEKPFVNARDVEDMIEACHKNNLMFMDGTMWVHHERTHEIYRNFIEKSSITKNNDASSSQLGEIQRVHTVLSRNFMDDKDTNIRFKHDKEPNGCMGDLGWYCIRGILWAFNWDMPVRVLSSSTFYNKNTIDSTGILWFSHGRVATFSCSFKNAGRQVFDLQGSKASLTIRDGIFFPFWNEPFEYPENANAKDHEKADKKTKVDVELQTRYYLVDENGNEKEHLVGACVQVNEMINDFVDGASKLKADASQSSGGKFSIWEDQTIKTQRVLDALVQSSEQHSTISIA